jgi:hypothetical protein
VLEEVKELREVVTVELETVDTVEEDGREVLGLVVW